jgi:hypothetical protein
MKKVKSDEKIFNESVRRDNIRNKLSILSDKLETKEDIKLRKNLLFDIDFINLNRKIEEKLS